MISALVQTCSLYFLEPAQGAVTRFNLSCPRRPAHPRRGKERFIGQYYTWGLLVGFVRVIAQKIISQNHFTSAQKQPGCKGERLKLECRNFVQATIDVSVVLDTF